MIDHKLHIAFIVDGNGRWAKLRNKPRTYGHKAGVKRLKELIDYLKDDKRILCLSFYLFSLENWKRDLDEITYLFNYLKKYLNDYKKDFIESNLKFQWTGFEDKLDIRLINQLKELQNLTKNNTGLIINFVFNYGGIQDIIHAAKVLQDNHIEVNEVNFRKALLTSNLPDVDLLIRTSGEQRISNYLLFLLSYSEFIFEPTKFPDYTIDIFQKNLEEYFKRDIRKGGYSHETK